MFKDLCESLGEPVLPSEIANTLEEGLQAARDIGYPVVLRPAFTLGGTGGGFADDEEECELMLKNALALSPVHQVLVEKSIKGYKEIEYEVMRDANDTAITICNMETLTLSVFTQATVLLLLRHKHSPTKSIICFVTVHSKLSENLKLRAVAMFSLHLTRFRSNII